MATVAERVGRGPCPNCGELLTFKRSAGKLLNFKCDACCSSGYSEPGGSTHDKWARTIKPFAAEAAPPISAPESKPAPAPAVAKKAGFSLESLA